MIDNTKSNTNININFELFNENNRESISQNCDNQECLQRFYTLIDGSGFIFRAFYAIKSSMLLPNGTPINAVYGYCSMLLKLLEERLNNDISQENEVIIVVFDSARYNFRNTIYKDYKANRKDVPQALIPQFSIIRDITSALNLPSIEMNMYEADDLIATYVKECTKCGDVCRIISSDKDLMQLIDDDKNIFMYDTMKNKILHEEDVMNKFSVKPKQVPDIQALIGDTSDNIPGVNGIGPKTAKELINRFGSLENLYSNLVKLKNRKLYSILINNKNNAFISKQLATLKNDIELPLKLKDIHSLNIDYDSFINFCRKLNFSSIIDRTLKLKNQLSIK